MLLTVCTHVTLNEEICRAKLDTGAQINVMIESLFKHIGKINKLPLYPKSDVKLVGFGNKNIEYIGTTVINGTHLTQTKKATFYVTKLNDDKMILGLCLCIDLQLLSVHCDNKCWCKSHVLQGDVKQQIMNLYPDLFSGVGTIKNAMVHLDVKPVLYHLYVHLVVFPMQFNPK